MSWRPRPDIAVVPQTAFSITSAPSTVSAYDLIQPAERGSESLSQPVHIPSESPACSQEICENQTDSSFVYTIEIRLNIVNVYVTFKANDFFF